MALVAVVAVAGGIAALSAYEAHVINVTAHIENALAVSTEALKFGTVFPQEYLTQDFEIRLSDSFKAEGNADDVNYEINQKTKCWDVVPGQPKPAEIKYAAVNYWDNQCPQGFYPMESLCPFLSKLPKEAAGEYNDTGVPSYFLNYQDGCVPRIIDGLAAVAPHAVGKLGKSQNDLSDTWTIDLKVPPVAGTIGQDWPANCAAWTVPVDGTDYGCDLWIEVTGISRAPTPTQGNTVLSLENKHGDGWFITVDQTYGTLEFDPSGCTFDFTLTAQGLPANTNYSLIYYADPWAGNHPGALIWSGSTDASGAISATGSPTIGTNIPDAADQNFALGGGKIWLIPSSAYDSATKTVIVWPYDQTWLFEYNLVKFTQEVCPPLP